MKMPIALTPLNLLLFVLMLASPWLGKFCRESLEKSSRSEEIQRIALRNSRNLETRDAKELKRPSNERKKVISTLKRMEQLQSKEQRIVAQVEGSSPSPEEAAKSNSQKTVPTPVAVNQSPQGEQLLVSLKEELKAPARTLRESPSLSKEEKKKIFYRKIKEYAKAKDFKKAEEAFLEQLEEMSLSPLESLEKQARFKQHFEKLTTHVKPKSS